MDENDGAQEGSTEALDLQEPRGVRRLGEAELIAAPVEVGTGDHVSNSGKSEATLEQGVLVQFTERIQRLVVNGRSEGSRYGGDEVQNQKDAESNSSVGYKSRARGGTIGTVSSGIKF